MARAARSTLWKKPRSTSAASSLFFAICLYRRAHAPLGFLGKCVVRDDGAVAGKQLHLTEVSVIRPVAPHGPNGNSGTALLVQYKAYCADLLSVRSSIILSDIKNFTRIELDFREIQRLGRGKYLAQAQSWFVGDDLTGSYFYAAHPLVISTSLCGDIPGVGIRIGTVSFVMNQQGGAAVPVWSVWCYGPDGTYYGEMKLLASDGTVISSDAFSQKP